MTKKIHSRVMAEIGACDGNTEKKKTKNEKTLCKKEFRI